MLQIKKVRYHESVKILILLIFLTLRNCFGHSPIGSMNVIDLLMNFCQTCLLCYLKIRVMK